MRAHRLLEPNTAAIKGFPYCILSRHAPRSGAECCVRMRVCHGLAQRDLHVGIQARCRQLNIHTSVSRQSDSLKPSIARECWRVRRVCIQPLQFSIHHLPEPRTALQQDCSLTTLLQEETPVLQMPMVPMLVQTQSAMMILQMCSYCLICLRASVSIDKELLSYISVYVHVVYSIWMRVHGPPLLMQSMSVSSCQSFKGSTCAQHDGLQNWLIGNPNRISWMGKSHKGQGTLNYGGIKHQPRDALYCCCTQVLFPMH